jgi:hypothetical protein
MCIIIKQSHHRIGHGGQACYNKHHWCLVSDLPWILRQLPSDCRRKWLRMKDTNWRLDCLVFTLLSVNLWAQEMRQCFSVKAS